MSALLCGTTGHASTFLISERAEWKGLKHWPKSAVTPLISVHLVEEGKPTEVDVTSCRVNNRPLDRVQKHKSSDAYEIAQPINYCDSLERIHAPGLCSNICWRVH